MEITLKDVTYHNHHQNVLSHINLHLEGPKIIGIMGLHKTLLLELISEKRTPTRGVIKINGKKKKEKQTSKKIVLIEQHIKDQYFYQTIEEEAFSILRTSKKSKEEIKKKIEQSLKMVGLDASYQKKVFEETSIGERKLLQIALELLENPTIILLDEPFTELDFQNKKRLIRLMKTLKEKYNKTIIIASNDSDMLYPLAEEMIILDGKGIIYQGKTMDLFKAKNLSEQYSVDVPDLIEFTNQAKKKKARISYHKDIRDLIKDVYKHV